MYLAAIVLWCSTIGVSVGFRRDEVESAPSGVQRTSESGEFGGRPLPLRTAVEKVLRQRSEVLPLREAVERRPAPFHRGVWWKLAPMYRQTDERGKRLFCFVESWSSYRRAPATFTVDHIDPYACTHIIYAFATVDPITSTIVPLDEEYDIIKGGYRSVVGLKRVNSNLKVLISISGRLSKMTSAASSRRDFILSLVKFIAENGFDGVDLHWQYPGAEELGGKQTDKEQLSRLVEELSGVVESRGWVLTLSVPPSRFRSDDGYDVPALSPYLHFILLKSFDYQLERSGAANHPAPLYISKQEDPLSLYYNVDYSVKFWLKRGARRSQLILGIPFFGRTYTLQDPDRWMPGSPVLSLGKEARYTQEPGLMSYYEVCSELKNPDWRKHRDPSTGSAFIVKDDQWVGFEDTYSIQLKMNYMEKERLGGVMVWALDLDDFRGICGEKNPLLNAVRLSLAPHLPAILSPGVGVTVIAQESGCSGEGYAGEASDCSVYYRCTWNMKHTYICPHGLHYDPHLNLCNWPLLVNCEGKADNTSTLHQSTQILHKKYSKLAKGDGMKVVCYFTNWSWYRKDGGKYVPEHLVPSLCTHVIYAFASLDPNSLTIAPFDPWADIDNDMYKRVTKLREEDVEVMIAIGGWTDSVGNKYSKMVESASGRKRFVDSVLAFLRRYNFSGLSLEWNYPVCWQSDCSKGPQSDADNYAKLAQELRESFNREKAGVLLSVSLSGYPEILEKSYDLRLLSDASDFLTVMTYDYHGAWEGVTGHIAPLNGKSSLKYSHYNIENAINIIASKGGDKSKLVVGIPMYGQSYTLRNKEDMSVGSKTSGPGKAGKYTLQPGMLSYYEICQQVKNNKWKKMRDENGAYSYSGDQWVSYDDEKTITNKGEYVKEKGLGGMMAWTVDLDDFENRCCEGQYPLLSAINRALNRKIPSLPTECNKPKPPSTPSPPSTTLDPEAGLITTTESGHHHGSESRPTPSRPWWTTESTTPWWTQQTTTSKPTSPWWTQQTTSRITTSSTRRPSTTKPSSPWWTQQTTSMTTSSTRRPSTTKPSSPWWTQQTTTSTASSVWWQPETTSTTTIKPQSTTEGLESGTGNEVPSSCQTGDYRPVPGNCNAFYRCILGEYRKQSCAGGLHWDNRRKICDWPSQAKCLEDIGDAGGTDLGTSSTQSSTTSTTTLPSSTSTSPSSTTTSTQPTQEGCEHGKYYPVSGKCDGFYLCVNGILLEQRCAPGLHWNADMSMCDWSFNVKCTASYSNVILKSNGGCTKGNFAPHHKNCNKYLQCLWDKYEVHSCAPGLHWNQKKKICDWPKSANCRLEGNDVESVASEKPHEISSTTEWSWKPEEQTEWSWTSTTTEEPWPDQPYKHPLSGYFKIVCYFTNWAWYRQGSGKYVPEDIDSDLCTHIIYGFAVLDYSELIIKPHDSWADFDNNFYKRVVWFRRKGVKVLLALGGWNDSQGDKYSRLVNNPRSRSNFVKHAVSFLTKYKFDGLDLDWEYPKCWQTDCKKGKSSDKEGFASWVRELKEEFSKHGLLLSAAVSPSKTIIDAGYDARSLAENLDWISVMTYDYHGQWDKKTGHVAPFYEHPADDFYYFNANYSINYWIASGVPRRKLVMGMPMYGQGFTLRDESKNGLNAPASGPSQAGEFTRAAGFLAYYEICSKIKNQDWRVVDDEEKRMGPYAYKGNQWVGFDDKEMIKLKCEYIREMDLGGGMIWALDLDDFRNICGQGKHPLLKTIAQTLAAPGGSSPISASHPEGVSEGSWAQETTSGSQHTSESTTPSNQVQGAIQTTRPQHTTQTTRPQQTTQTTQPQQSTQPTTPSQFHSNFKVVCYFTNWAWYRQGTGKYLPSDIDPQLCTHIIYGFAVLDRDSLLLKPHDSWADIDNKFYEKVTKLKERGVKVSLALGGWNDSLGDKYSRLVNNPSARAAFNRHVLQFILDNNFDGLDLDWEYPKCWQVDCKKGPSSDKEGFARWISELRELFEPHHLLLSAAVSPAKTVIDNGYDVRTLSDKLDWIAVMCYDYHGQWDKRTGHVAPMYVHDEDIDTTFNANFSMHYWLEKGGDRSKLVMGMPMYGQSFSLADNNKNGLNAPTYGGGEAGDETRARGFLSYYEICERILKRNWELVRDETGAMGPYARSRDQWVSFDDAGMIKHKAEYVKRNGFGGAMIWALDLDDFRNTCGCEEYPLLKTINRVLRDYPPGRLCTLDSSPNKHLDSFRIDSSCPSITGDKKNCEKYYTCQFGILVEQTCPPGLHFSQDSLMCDWPENAKCRGEESSEGIAGSSVDHQQIVSGSSGDYKIVCYFTNWAWYRQGKGKFLPENIDPSLCTHIVYAFSVLDGETLEMKAHDSWADIDNSFFTKVSSLAEKGIKVLLGLGGWNDSLGDKYSRLVNSPRARRKFINSAIAFINKYKFGGLDLDWEYPKCWQVDCKKGPESDKEGFAALVMELSTEFKRRGWLLSAAVSPSKAVIDQGYDVGALSKYLDWISIMAYDYHGHWDGITGHVAPIYLHPKDLHPTFNLNFTVHYWLEEGAAREKLILGMPLYGQSFTLANSSDVGLNAPTTGPGSPGQFTRAAGFLAFYEICEIVSGNDWKIIRDEEMRLGPIATNHKEWISYDDVEDIRRKTELIKALKLGGGMVWALDLDDFSNICGCGSNPLLTTINNQLRTPRHATTNCT